MKAVVGIDATQESLQAISLIGRLGLNQPHLQLVHVIERLFPDDWANKPQQANDLLTQFLQMQEKEGQQWLDRAAARARETGLPAECSLKFGSNVANQLLQTAEESKADLLVVGSRDESAFGKLLIGSVGRKIVPSSSMSLCINRTDWSSESQGLDAVFATDHSDYATRCVETLLKLAPRGLRRLTVMTAYPHEMIRSMRSFMPHVPKDVSQWLEEHLKDQNHRLSQRLSPLGCEIQYRVIADDPDAAIDTVMAETGSRLLIMGAQGQGFLERLATGSHTFRQAISGKHSVLILRAP